MAVIFYEPGIQRSTRYGGLLLGLYVGVRSFVTGMQWMWSMARKYNVEGTRQEYDISFIFWTTWTIYCICCMYIVK